MSQSPSKLSDKAIAILEMIAAGNSYEQILSANPNLTYIDIFYAAEEALNIAVIPVAAEHSQSLSKRRERYHRAYEKWTDAEDLKLRQSVQSGSTVACIANLLQRNRGAIRSRIMKLGLTELLIPKERRRFDRMMSRLKDAVDLPTDNDGWSDADEISGEG